MAPELAVVDGAAVEAGVMVAEATQSFWQFSYARFSAAVPFPWEQLEMHSIVAFCWALLPSETAIHFALQLGSVAEPGFVRLNLRGRWVRWFAYRQLGRRLRSSEPESSSRCPTRRLS